MPVPCLTGAYLLARTSAARASGSWCGRCHAGVPIKTLDFGMRSRVDTAQEATISLRLFIPGLSRKRRE